MLLDECAMHRLCLVNLWPTEHFIERAARSDSPPVSHQQWAPANRVVCLEGHWRRPLGAFIYRWSIARARPVIEDDTQWQRTEHVVSGDGWSVWSVPPCALSTLALATRTTPRTAGSLRTQHQWWMYMYRLRLNKRVIIRFKICSINKPSYSI